MHYTEATSVHFSNRRQIDMKMLKIRCRHRLPFAFQFWVRRISNQSEFGPETEMNDGISVCKIFKCFVFTKAENI